MEINRKLEHLTEEQIEEVITMYKDKSIRLSNIISKYNIERILNKKTTILKDIASAENLRKWKNLEKDYNRQTAYAEE